MNAVEALAEAWKDFDVEEFVLAEEDIEIEFYENQAERVIDALRKRGFDVVPTDGDGGD